MAGKSRVQGAIGLRRTLRLINPEVRESVADELESAGRWLLGRAKQQAPFATGGLRGALAFKVARKSLTLTLGLISKATQRRFFYGYILDAGRGGSKKVDSIGRAISPIAKDRYNFVFGRRKAFQYWSVPRLRTALTTGLENAIAEGGDE